MVISLEEDRREALNSQGFTLIELLAVIVILGVLMIIAIPQVTKYINNSRKDAFADSALAYINSARYSLLNDEYDISVPDDQNSVCIPLDYVGTEKETKSPYNGNWKKAESYVKATNDKGTVTYSIYLVDSTNHSTTGEVTEVVLADISQKRGKIKQNGGASTCSCTSGTDQSGCTVSGRNGESSTPSG